MITTVASALVPAFFVMGLGHFAGRKKIIDNQHVSSLNALLMMFALPLSLFVAMAQTPADRLSSCAVLGVVLTVSMLILFGVATFLGRWVFGKSASETAVQALNVSLPNYAAVGLPLLGTIVGPEGLTSVSIAIAAGTVIMSPLALIILDGQTPAARNIPAARRIAMAFVRAIKKPVVIGPVAGVVLALAGHPLPKLVVQTFSLIGQATAGLALFVTGLVLSSQALKFNVNVSLSILMKNILHPLLVFGIALLVGLKSYEIHQAILLAAIPSGFFGVLFGLNYGINSQDGDSTLTLSSLLSIVTLAAAILLTNGMK